jgi:hypothetical protein
MYSVMVWRFSCCHAPEGRQEVILVCLSCELCLVAGAVPWRVRFFPVLPLHGAVL